MTKRLIGAAVLTLLALVAGFFSLWIQLDPFSGAPGMLALVSAASGLAFAAAGHIIAGAAPPQGFALTAASLNGVAAALAGILLVYA